MRAVQPAHGLGDGSRKEPISCSVFEFGREPHRRVRRLKAGVARTAPDQERVENLKTVVLWKVWPGRRTVEGKFGLLIESG